MHDEKMDTKDALMMNMQSCVTVWSLKYIQFAVWIKMNLQWCSCMIGGKLGMEGGREEGRDGGMAR